VARTPILLIVLAGLTFGLVGCDSRASQQAEAQRHLDAALAKLRQANAGYIEQAEDKSTESEGLLVYRQETMDAAFEDLNKVMSLDAPLQKAQALRLGAEIDASAARHAARQAAVENAAINGRSTVLLGYLSAMEGSSARSDALAPQTDEQLAKLLEEIKTQNAKQDQLTDVVAQLDDQIQAVSAEVEQFKARADAGYAQAQTLREQAFVASGDQMYDLQDQAADLDRKAAIESASAEGRQVLVDDLNARLALDRVQLDTVNKLLDELNGQVQTTRTDTARLADESKAAAQSSDQAAETLAKEYKQLTDVHAVAVQKRMKLAGEKSDKSVDALKQASNVQEARGDLESIRLQLLSAYIDQAHIATSHATYLRDLANTTRAVLNSVGRVSPDNTDLYTSQLSELTDAQIALRNKANQVIEAGLALAEELAPEGTTVDDGGSAAIAQQQKDRLNVYGDRLNIISNGS
jgi:uncharacterized protein YoxC